MLTRRTVLATGLLTAAGQAAAAKPDYEQALVQAYGAPIDARAAHRRALAEVRRLRFRADTLLRGQGLVRGTVGVRIAALFADERFLYPDDNAGRDQAVSDMNVRLIATRPRLSQAFGDLLLPAAQVRRMSPADEAMQRGGYREPLAYYVDLAAIRDRPAWTLPSVAFHETVPGHALQAAVSGSTHHAPAFSEAWAIYAEQLCADLGAYHGDPLGELGYIHWRLFRMARIVADTGLGVMGWSRDQASAAMTAIQGHPVAFTTVATDVARMQASPGLYAAQGFEALEISRLRPRVTGRWPAHHLAVLTDARPLGE